MTRHPLQDVFDRQERNATEPCPYCGAVNPKDWRECSFCGLLRRGWRGNATVYYRSKDCSVCGDAIEVEDLRPEALEAAECPDPDGQHQFR